jgi:hypothetical protein
MHVLKFIIQSKRPVPRKIPKGHNDHDLGNDIRNNVINNNQKPDSKIL